MKIETELSYFYKLPKKCLYLSQMEDLGDIATYDFLRYNNLVMLQHRIGMRYVVPYLTLPMKYIKVINKRIIFCEDNGFWWQGFLMFSYVQITPLIRLLYI